MIELMGFHGIVPRQILSNLKLGYAEVAHDVRLWHGTIEPWREPLAVERVAPNTQTIHQWGCCWYSWDKCVEVAEWTVSCPRLYVTGDKPYPAVYPLYNDCTTGCGQRDHIRLGVPAPTSAIRATALPVVAHDPNSTTANAESREGRAYLYTYVNCLGEEGPPSYPSNEVVTDDGAQVTLTGFTNAPPEYGVEEIRIYRRVTGFIGEQEAMTSAGHMSDYFHVGTIAADGLSFVDDLANVDALGDILPSLEYLSPPAELRGITAIDNSMILAGFVGNTLMFSVNNQPWNWPESHRYDLDDNIVALANVGGSLLVLTDGHPYTVALNLGSVDGHHEPVRHVYPMPMITCCSDRGVVATAIGAFFVTSRGVALMGESGPPTLITSTWFAQDDWRRLKPETMRLGYYDGALFIVSDSEAFILFLDTNTYGAPDNHRLTTISDRPRMMHVGRNGELFLLSDDGVVQQWDSGDTLRPYRWKSAHLRTGSWRYFGAFRLWADSAVDLTIFAEDKAVYSAKVLTNEAYRLPFYGHHLRQAVQFTGTGRIESLELALDRRGLSRAGV